MVVVFHHSNGNLTKTLIFEESVGLGTNYRRTGYKRAWGGGGLRAQTGWGNPPFTDGAATATLVTVPVFALL